MSQQSLPDKFHDLERFVAKWALPTEFSRNRARLASTMEDIQGFYDTMLPRMDAIVEYLNQFPLDELSTDATHLLNLGLAFMEISPCVELYGEADLPWAVRAEVMEIRDCSSGRNVRSPTPKS